jgi:exodeoxyribonuclease-3
MFRILTLNANGIRSADRKGLFKWLPKVEPDVVCLQEVKAHEADISDACRFPTGWHGHFHCAERKGYSGTALYSVKKPRSVRIGFGSTEFDAEGRYIEARFSSVTVVCVYFPSGTSGPERQAAKYRFLDQFLPHLDRLAAAGQEVIVCGDVNIAHREIDLKNWRANQKNSGFLPEERKWLDELFGTHNFVDAFRVINGEPDQYTWWSNRGRAWEKNVGWRIDYHIITAALADRVRRADIYKARRFSDHAPLTIDYDLELGGKRAGPSHAPRATDAA